MDASTFERITTVDDFIKTVIDSNGEKFGLDILIATLNNAIVSESIN